MKAFHHSRLGRKRRHYPSAPGTIPIWDRALRGVLQAVPARAPGPEAQSQRPDGSGQPPHCSFLSYPKPAQNGWFSLPTRSQDTLHKDTCSSKPRHWGSSFYGYSRAHQKWAKYITTAITQAHCPGNFLPQKPHSTQARGVRSLNS